MLVAAAFLLILLPAVLLGRSPVSAFSWLYPLVRPVVSTVASRHPFFFFFGRMEVYYLRHSAIAAAQQ
jgi:hypothetical protein